MVEAPLGELTAVPHDEEFTNGLDIQIDGFTIAAVEYDKGNDSFCVVTFDDDPSWLDRIREWSRGSMAEFMKEQS